MHVVLYKHLNFLNITNHKTIMRKIYLLLLTLLCAVGAWAEQTNVAKLTISSTTTTTPVEGRYYVIKTIDTNGNRYYMYDNGTVINDNNSSSITAQSTLPVYGDDIHRFLWEVTVSEGKYRFINKQTNKQITLNPSSTGANGGDNGTVTMTDNGTDIVIETNSDGYVALGNGSGQYVDMSGSGRKPCTWSDGVKGTRRMTIYEANVELVTLCDVTYKYKYNGNVVGTQPYTCEQGEAYPTAKPHYSIITGLKIMPSMLNFDFPTGNVSSDAEFDVNVTMAEPLPFEPTTITNGDFADGTKWYLLSLGSSSEKKYAKYDGTNFPLSVSNNDLLDASLFTFTGDIINGFQIYNKAVGATKAVYSNTPDDNGTAISPEASPTDSWTIGRNSNGGFCLKQEADYFMNDRDSKLSFWKSDWSTGATGSNVSFEEVSVEMLSGYINTIGEGLGYYSVSSTVLAGANEVVTKGDNATFDEVRNAITDLKNNRTLNVPQTERYYRMRVASQSSSKDNYVSAYGNGRNLNTKSDAPIQAVVPTTFFLTSDNKLKVVYNGEFISKKKEDGNIAGGYDKLMTTSTESDAITWSIEAGVNAGTLRLRSNENSLYLYDWTTYNRSNVLLANEPKGTRCQWTIEEVKDYEISIGATGYATTYLPFDVTLPNGLIAYAVTGASGNVATLVSKNSIPAGQGALLKGTAGQNYLLTISATPVDIWSGNLLNGTYTTQNIIPETGKTCYVLAANASNEAGFYKAELNQEGGNAFQNNATKAYLPLNTTSDPNPARVLTFNFDDNTETGINAVEIEEAAPANAAIYDLSGRRVQSAKSGLYIINGKKVIK